MRYSPFAILLVSGVLVGFPAKVCFAQDEQAASARKVISKVVPVYPQIARTMNLSGTVKLQVEVQANGGVKSIQVRGGNPLLAQSAQSAVHAWKWEKAEHDSTEQVEFLFSP